MELNTTGYSMAYARWICLTGRESACPGETWFIAWEFKQQDSIEKGADSASD